MKIRIKKTPNGSVAPKEVRKDWVDLEFPAEEGEKITIKQCCKKKTEKGFYVDRKIAIEILQDNKREAGYDFWNAVLGGGTKTIFFHKRYCEVIK